MKPANEVLTWGVLLMAGAQPALPCDFCAVFAATEAQGGSGAGFFAGVAGQYTDFNTFQSGGRDEPNPDAEHLKSLISQAFIGYNFNDRFGVQFNLPVIHREWSKTGAEGSETGVGDAVMLGTIHLYERQAVDFTFRWSALAGVKLPTGNSSHLNPAEPDFAAGIGGHDLALGSGSFDGLAGTDLFARWRKLFLTAGIQYAIRSEGDFGYQFANDLSWSAGPGVYLLLNEDYTLSLQAFASGETKGQDTLRGAPTDDTAETRCYLGPRIHLTRGSKLSMQIGADLPVSLGGTGNQIVPDYRVHAAFNLRF